MKTVLKNLANLASAVASAFGAALFVGFMAGMVVLGVVEGWNAVRWLFGR